ncbi:MAG: hypothetical protein ABW198_10475 [Pseudorhodoplanes sp.]
MTFKLPVGMRGRSAKQKRRRYAGGGQEIRGSIRRYAHGPVTLRRLAANASRKAAWHRGMVNTDND